jgi:hypothetical protein
MFAPADAGRLADTCLAGLKQGGDFGAYDRRNPAASN